MKESFMLVAIMAVSFMTVAMFIWPSDATLQAQYRAEQAEAVAQQARAAARIAEAEASVPLAAIIGNTTIVGIVLIVVLFVAIMFMWREYNKMKFETRYIERPPARPKVTMTQEQYEILLNSHKRIQEQNVRATRHPYLHDADDIVPYEVID